MTACRSGAQQPWPDPLPPQFWVESRLTGRCNQAPLVVFSLLLAAYVSSLGQLHDSPLPHLEHHERAVFLRLLALQSMVGVFPCFLCVSFPLLPNFLWRGPRWHAPRIFLPFLAFIFQQPDFKVPFPLLLQVHILLRLSAKRSTYWSRSWIVDVNRLCNRHVSKTECAANYAIFPCQ